MTTKKTDTPMPAAPAPGDELAQLREENAVLKAQNDTILDGLITVQEEIANLKKAQTGAAATAVAQNDTQTVLDAELARLAEEFKDYPLIDVFERRALVGMDANLEIRLKDEPSVVEDAAGTTRRWKLRWFNFSKEGRAQQATAEGYIKVRWDELQDQESIAAATRSDDFVRKGERGLEVLCKMPLKLYEYKKRRDAARLQGLLSSEKAVQNHVAESVAGMVAARGGNADQAGSFIAGKQFSMRITAGETERFTP